MDKDKILQKAIDINGHYPQIDMFTEECGELLQALNKMKRLTNYSGLILPPTEFSSLKYANAYWDTCSEIADVRILIRQLEKIFNKEAVDLAEDRKIERLEKRLNNNTF